MQEAASYCNCRYLVLSTAPSRISLGTGKNCPLNAVPIKLGKCIHFIDEIYGPPPRPWHVHWQGESSVQVAVLSVSSEDDAPLEAGSDDSVQMSKS
jgi:hypothetical protein